MKFILYFIQSGPEGGGSAIVRTHFASNLPGRLKWEPDRIFSPSLLTLLTVSNISSQPTELLVFGPIADVR